MIKNYCPSVAHRKVQSAGHRKVGLTQIQCPPLAQYSTLFSPVAGGPRGAARLVAMWHGAPGGSSLRPSSPAISPEISSTNAPFPSIPAVSPSAEPGPSMSTSGIQTMLPQFGQIERRAVGPHGASRIKMEGSEKASLRNLRFLLAQHPVGVRVLQAAREAAIGDTRTPSPNPNPNANPNPSPSRSPIPTPIPSPSPSLNPNQAAVDDFLGDAAVAAAVSSPPSKEVAA